MSTDLVREQKPVEEPEAHVQEHGEVLRVTRGNIGEAITTTSAAGRVTFLNSLAESLTGWSCPEAMGQPWEAVLPIVNEASQRQLERAVAEAIT
jgi:PAS domain S-box-containing protein